MSEGDDAQAFRKGVDNGQLFIGQQPIVWQRLGRTVFARLTIEGVPDTVTAFVHIHIKARIDEYTIAVIWNGTRLYGFDKGGPPHRTARGKSIRTPHRQWYREDGEEEAEAVNTEESGIILCETALRYLLEWCGLTSGHQWIDQPPLQPNLDNSGG